MWQEIADLAPQSSFVEIIGLVPFKALLALFVISSG
jgi:hypothetical protein